MREASGKVEKSGGKVRIEKWTYLAEMISDVFYSIQLSADSFQKAVNDYLDKDAGD